jgi:hypothetical protein
MSLESKNIYRAFAISELCLPIFLHPCYLDAVVGENGWDVLVIQINNEVKAAHPYIISNFFLGPVLTQPIFSQFLGPYISTSVSSSKDKQKYLMMIVDSLPNFKYYNQNWSHSILNWLPFHWNGFLQTTRYSYSIDLSNSKEDLWNNLSSSYRNKIRKAIKGNYLISTNCKPIDFFRLQSDVFKRQNLSSPIELNKFLKFDSRLSEINKNLILCCKNSNGEILSGAYLLFDNNRCYLNMFGESNDSRNLSTGIYLIWESILYAKEILGVKIFDFQGSMIRSIEITRRDFGANQEPYFNIYKANNYLFKLFLAYKLFRHGK